MSARRPPPSAARDRLPPPAIESLSDVAWARVERAVLAELDAPAPSRAGPAALDGALRSRRRWITAGALGLAAAAGIALALFATSTGTPARSSLTAGLGRPSRIVTGTAGSELAFGDARVVVAPSSAIVLDGSADHGVLAVLERGSTTFVVAPRHDRPAFVVQAGAVVIHVVGTELVVTRLADDDAEVTVRVGVVEVAYRGETTRVSAGQTWSSLSAAVSPATPATPATPPSAATTPGAPGSSTTGGTSAGTTGGSSAGTTGGSSADLSTGTRSEPNAGARPASPTSGSRPTSPTTGASPTGPTTGAHPTDPTVSADSRQTRFERASRLEATDPTAAIAGYRELARGRDAWAGNALYALGRLAHDRGDRAQAREALDDYLRRFPRGANAADARALRDTLSGADR